MSARTKLILHPKQKIAIIGMGKSGTSALRLLQEMGHAPEKIATFDHQKKLDRSHHYQNPEHLLKNFAPDLLCVSPGVPLQQGWLSQLRPHTEITSELDLACLSLQEECLVGVTGSAGKSTTVALLAEGQKKAEPRGFTGGNLGTPLADYALEVLRGRPRAETVILELSSYQLENFRFELDVSALVSLLPNHLDRYPDLESYYATKWNLVRHTKGPCFLAQSNPDLQTFAAKMKPENSIQWISPTSHPIRLLGSANSQNHAIAFAIGRHLGWGTDALRAMDEFSGLPHRFENCGLVHGVQWINDSKATTADSVLFACEQCLALFPQQKIWLLLGGRDKSLPWERLRTLRGIHVVFFGEAANLAKAKSQLAGATFPTLKAALRHLATQLLQNDVVLLSPGGSSQDEFSNFEERGDFFKKELLKFGFGHGE